VKCDGAVNQRACGLRCIQDSDCDPGFVCGPRQGLDVCVRSGS
jgi:hypothetical protein